HDEHRSVHHQNDAKSRRLALAQPVHGAGLVDAAIVQRREAHGAIARYPPRPKAGGWMLEWSIRSRLGSLAERNPVSVEVQNGASVQRSNPAGRISCVVHVAVLVANRGRWRIRLRS